jgi:hypothetical protein
MKALFSFIDESDGPFFAHTHMHGTHGPRFFPTKKVYSRGRKQTEDWMTDFYDDAIINFDMLVGKVVKGLEERGLDDNTLIIILTDHGKEWSVHDRIPLLFHFPGGEHSGRIRSNTQILDIAPTILDYLGMAIPEWMEGSSLLQGEPDPGRYIFTTTRLFGDVLDKSEHDWKMDTSKAGPPFYSMGKLGVIFRDKLYKLRLKQNTLEISTIEGHTYPDVPAETPSVKAIEQMLVDHLIDSGYDTSSLERPFNIKRIPAEGEALPQPAGLKKMGERPKRLDRPKRLKLDRR